MQFIAPKRRALSELHVIIIQNTSRSKLQAQIKLLLIYSCFLLVSCFDYSTTLKMMVICPIETSDSLRISQRCKPDDRTLQMYSDSVND
jgi:hypothetical protein